MSKKFQPTSDLCEDVRDTPLIAARVLGRQIKTILNRSLNLQKRIITILENEIGNTEKSKIAELMVTGTENTIVAAIDILKAVSYTHLTLPTNREV